jgi:hypothetical protein
MVRILGGADQGTHGKVFNGVLYHFQHGPPGQEWFVLRRFILALHSHFPGWERVEIEEHWLEGWIDNNS